MGAPITVGTLENVYVDTATPVNSATGNPMPDIYDIKMGGRRRKSRKSGRKSRKTRKMKGGYTPGMESAGQVGYGYVGTGAGGLADAKGYVQAGNRI